MTLEVSKEEAPIDISFDTNENTTEEITSLNLDTEETTSLTEKTTPSDETMEHNDNFSFDLGAEEIDSSNSSSISGNDSSISGTNMNDILETTISQLDMRKNEISDEVQTQSAKAKTIDEDIKKLEIEHDEVEGAITLLKSESSKITTTISQLKKMKLDPVKDHNAKRTKK